MREVVAIDMWSNRQVVWRALLFGLLLISWTAVNSVVSYMGWSNVRDDISTHGAWLTKHEAQIRAINQLDEIETQLTTQNELLVELVAAIKKENPDVGRSLQSSDQQ